MPNTPDRDEKRIRLIRKLFGFAIVIAFVACIVGYLSPTKADIAAEELLLGKWAVWIEGSDMTQPTQRIIEWLPDGQTAHYSPTMEPWGSSADANDRSSNWRIRNGKLIIEMHAPEIKDGMARQECQLDWQNKDTLKMTTDVGSEAPVTVVYKRVKPDAPQGIESGRTM